MGVEKDLAGKVTQNVVLDRPSDMKNGSAIAATAAKCSDGLGGTNLFFRCSGYCPKLRFDMISSGPR